jgi:transcription factor TFIIIB component B''
MSDASGVVTPISTNSEMDNFSDSYNDKLTDENLSNLSQQTVQKVSAFDSA